MPLPEPKFALVREPSPAYGAFYAARGIAVSDPLAHQQHDAYTQALKSTGLAVTSLPAHPTLHDCVFIEDTAILWNRRALITRMTPLREGEQSGVRQWLANAGFEIVTLPEGARIEGGDVMHLEEQTWVGLTERTNAAGVEALQGFMDRDVRAIEVGRCLHLKSAMTYLGNRTILISPALIDVQIPQDYTRLDTPVDEPHAANVLRIGPRIICAAGFPKTFGLLQRFAAKHHCEVISVEITEFQKGDGAITCSSLLW